MVGVDSPPGASRNQAVFFFPGLNRAFFLEFSWAVGVGAKVTSAKKFYRDFSHGRCGQPTRGFKEPSCFFFSRPESSLFFFPAGTEPGERSLLLLFPVSFTTGEQKFPF